MVRKVREWLATGADLLTVALGLGGFGAVLLWVRLQTSQFPQPELALLVASAFLVIAGVGGRLWYAIRPDHRGGATPRPEQASGSTEPAMTPVPAPANPLAERLRAVTGETLVRDVVSAWAYLPTQYLAFGKYIPVHPALDLKLAEVALLRRMTTRLERKRSGTGYYENLSENLSSSECEGILTAGGITNPRHSMVRLEGRHLVGPEASGERPLVMPDPGTGAGGGTRVASDFTECLVRDPLLSAAYHKVSLAIDKVIQPEPMRLLVGDNVTYEGWLYSIGIRP